MCQLVSWSALGNPYLRLPSGKRLHSYGKSPFLMAKSTINGSCSIAMFEGSLEVKLPTIWRDEKQSRAEAERRGRLEERRSEEKE